MALRKAIATQFGVNAKYWNIALYQNNLKDRVLYVKLYGYSDKAARDEGAAPMHVLDVRFEGEDYIQEMTLADVYKAIKNNPDFLDSEDLL